MNIHEAIEILEEAWPDPGAVSYPDLRDAIKLAIGILKLLENPLKELGL